MKKIALILSPFGLLIFLFVFMSFLGRKTILNNSNFFFPIVTPFPFQQGNRQSNLTITSITPPDSSVNIPLNQVFTIKLNSTFSSKDVVVDFAPKVTYSSSVQDKSYVITPTKPLLANSTYQMFIRFNDISFYTYSFSTISDQNQPQQDDASEIEKEINRHNYPDSYLSAFTPHAENDFSISSDFSNDTDHFFFTITLTGADKNKSKQEVIAWIKSTGLTDNQIASLDIRYQ